MRLIKLVVLFNLLYGCSSPINSNINHLTTPEEEITSFLSEPSSFKIRSLKYIVNSTVVLPEIKPNIDKIYLKNINNSLVTYHELSNLKKIENIFSKVVIYQDELNNIKIEKYIDGILVNSESISVELFELKEIINTETLIVKNLNNISLKIKINVIKHLVLYSINNSSFYINE